MNYVHSFNLFGVDAKQIPSLLGAGAPTTTTEGAVGLFYMDTDTGELYVCVNSSNGVYTWKHITQTGAATQSGIIPATVE